MPTESSGAEAHEIHAYYHRGSFGKKNFGIERERADIEICRKFVDKAVTFSVAKESSTYLKLRNFKWLNSVEKF